MGLNDNMPPRHRPQAAPRPPRSQLNRVYAAIADPTRRAILGVLAGGQRNVGSVARRFPISFNAVSKHLKGLGRAGLGRPRVRGREHWLRLPPEPLRQATPGLEPYRGVLEARVERRGARLAGSR